MLKHRWRLHINVEPALNARDDKDFIFRIVIVRVGCMSDRIERHNLHAHLQRYACARAQPENVA